MKKVINITIGILVLMLCGTLNTYGQYPGSNQVMLEPSNIPKFVDPLPHYAGKRVNAKSGGRLIIKEVPTKQAALSTGTMLSNGKIAGSDSLTGVTDFWAYSISSNGGKTWTPATWPSYTIETSQNHPLRVEYRNELYGQKYSNLNLPLDQTLMWAAPGVTGNVMTDPYSGDVPMVVHLHGGQTPSASDGGPNDWFTPGYAKTGPTWGKYGVNQYYTYPNAQEPTTLWFHDHVMGATRLNVYAGLLGMYILRGADEESDKLPGWSKDDLVKEVPRSEGGSVYTSIAYKPEIELILQDHMFDTNGENFFPVEPTNPSINPFWGPEFFGNVITVNGKTWPYLSVAPRKYRFRVLNGANARFFNLWLQNAETGENGPVITQVGTDGGLLDKPVILNPLHGDSLFLGPTERADIVVDFSGVAPGAVFTLMNSANAPYPGGDPVEVGTTDRVMQFVVNGLMINREYSENQGTDKSAVPMNLRKTPLVRLTNFEGKTNLKPDKVRQLTLNEIDGDGGPRLIVINNSRFNTMSGMGQFGEVTETPVEGTTELWQIINTTEDAHPIHIHLVQFQLVSRQSFDVERFEKDYEKSFTGINGGMAGMYMGGEGPPFMYNQPNSDGAVGGNPAISAYLNGPVVPATPAERGWKDTYKVFPGVVTTFIIRFAPTTLKLKTRPGQLLYGFDPGKGPGYVWHCHILDHEDNEMMRPYGVISSPFRNKEVQRGYNLAQNQKLMARPSFIALGYHLEQNFPNPVKGQTEIQFSLPANVHVQLTLFNQAGEVVQQLIDAEAPAGKNIVNLNTDHLNSGIYYYQLKSPQYVDMKKMVVIK